MAGSADCGKSQLVSAIGEVLGLTEDEFIELNVETWSDDSQTSQLTGAAPGMVGHEQQTSLPFALARAIGRPVLRKVCEGGGSEQEKAADEQACAQEAENEKKPLPSIIVLIFDEFDKAHHSLSKKLHTFLETGTLRSANGFTFHLPDKVRLLVFFTANYAPQSLARLRECRDHGEQIDRDAPEQCVTEDMKRRGIDDSFLNRITHFSGFPPLTKSEMEILQLELMKSECLAATRNRQAISKIEFNDPTTMHRCCEEFMRSHDAGRGVRHARKKIQTGLRFILQVSEDYAEENLKDCKWPLSPHPVMSLKSYHPPYVELQTLLNDSPASFDLVQHGDLSRRIQESSDTIQAAVLTYSDGQRQHVINVYPLTLINVNVVNTYSVIGTQNNYISFGDNNNPHKPKKAKRDAHLAPPKKKKSRGRQAAERKEKKRQPTGRYSMKVCDRCGREKPSSRFPEYEKGKVQENGSKVIYICHRPTCLKCKRL